MIIFPAIDIKDGKVVRLLQGQFDKVTEYDHDPVAMAQKWQDEGAQWLHVVDLDGAKDGKILNLPIILKIAQTVSIPIEMGGGIRTIDDIKQLIDGGISRVILGTRAIQNREFLKEALAKWGDKIAVSIDCSNGMVAQRGWQSTSDLKATEFVKELETLGVQCIIYTDIARDGMLNGPNFEGLEEILNSTTIPVIASGGVANLDDLKKLSTLQSKGVIGAITGKAIYEGKLNIKDALELKD